MWLTWFPILCESEMVDDEGGFGVEEKEERSMA